MNDTSSTNNELSPSLTRHPLVGIWIHTVAWPFLHQVVCILGEGHRCSDIRNLQRSSIAAMHSTALQKVCINFVAGFPAHIVV